MFEKVFIVAGHGKGDSGAVVRDITERDIVVNIAKEVKRILGDSAILIGVSPELKLLEKISHINQVCRDNNYNHKNSLLVSIHCNAAGSALADGCEAYYYEGSDRSKRFARGLMDAVHKYTGIKTRQVKPDTATRHKRLGIIRDTLPLAVLLECGFITNNEDLEILLGDYKKIAKAIALQCGEFLQFDPEKNEESKEYRAEKAFKAAIFGRKEALRNAKDYERQISVLLSQYPHFIRLLKTDGSSKGLFLAN